MGFAIQVRDGKACPLLLCDGCGEQIDDWKQANALYRPEERQLVPASFTHKRLECNRAAEVRMGVDRANWIGLHDYLAWLLWNHDWGNMKVTQDGIETDVMVVEIRRPIL